MHLILVLGKIPNIHIKEFRKEYNEKEYNEQDIACIQVDSDVADRSIEDRVTDKGLVLRYCTKIGINHTDVIGAILPESEEASNDIIPFSFTAYVAGRPWPALQQVGIVRPRDDGKGTWLEVIPVNE